MRRLKEVTPSFINRLGRGRLAFVLKGMAVMGLGSQAAALPLWAQDLVFKGDGPKASLIELYSSEGCSSCPPAEAWMNSLKKSPGLWKEIFPVAFHVDYWDGLGWPDRFARAEYTQRQRNYAAQLGQNSVYTPEFVVNGLEWRRNWLTGWTLPTGETEKTGKLSLVIKDKKLSATYAPETSAPAQPLTLNVAWLGFNLVTDVKRGENDGRKLEHDFVVLNLGSSSMSSKGDAGFQGDPVEMKSSTSDVPGAVVAWVSDKDGSILQIAGGWLVPGDREALN